MISDDGKWRERPVATYVLTRGRVHPTRNSISVGTLLKTSGREAPPETGRQQRALLRLCGGLLSVAEAAVYLGLPVSVVVVLVSDLVDSGHLNARAHTARPDRELLEEVLRGLQQLR